MDKTFKENVSTFFVLLFLACVSVLLCSSNTFLHSLNDASFVNYNITVANAMRSGLAPYKDIFTQAGPLVLLMYMFVTLFENPFAIITAIEVQTALLFSFFVYKIIKRYLKENIITLVATGVVTVLTYTSASFASGGMTEELMLPILAYLLLCLLEFVYDKKQFGIFRTVAIAITLVIVVWTKIELLILPIILLVVWAVYCIKNKQVKQIFSKLLIIIVINLVATLLIVWYLYFNKALADFGAQYFVYNFNIVSTLLNLAKNAGLLILAILGIVLGQIRYKKEFLSISISAGLYLVILLFTAEEISNVLPLAIFSLFGVIFIFKWLQNGKYKEKINKVALYVIAIVSIVYCAIFSNSIREFDRSINDYAHYKVFAKMAEYNIETPKLLCYKMEDIGLYNKNIQANTKLFASNQYISNNQELMAKFDEIVQTKAVDFIVTEKSTYQDNKDVFKGYYTYVAEFSYEKIEDYFTIPTTLVLLKK